MSTQHTPGPWRVRQHPGLPDEFHVSALTPAGHPYFGVTKETEVMSDEDYPTKRADACLIASAPDLLAERDRLRESNKELLRLITDFSKLVYYDAQYGHFALHEPENYPTITHELVIDAKAAIAHAQEQKP